MTRLRRARILPAKRAQTQQHFAALRAFKAICRSGELAREAVGRS